MSVNVKIEAQYEQFLTATQLMGELFKGVMQGMKEELHAQAEAAKQEMAKETSAFEDMSILLKSKMSGIEGIVKGAKAAWAEFAIIGETVNLFREAAHESAHLAHEAIEMGAKLGISATQASRLRVALELNGVTTKEFENAANHLNLTLAHHEERLTQAGIATRDASGHLRNQVDLTIDAIEALQHFKEGTDRNVEEQRLFGRGVHLSAEMLEMTRKKLEEGKEFADAYGLSIGKDGVAKSESFIEAQRKLGVVFEGIKNVIGQAVLPILSELTKFLTGHGKEAMTVIRVAIAEVTSIFYGLKYAGEVLWKTLSTAFSNLMELGSAFGKVMRDVLSGNFSAAADDIKTAIGNIGSNYGNLFDSIMDGATRTHDSLANLWSNALEPGAVQDSGKLGEGDRDADANAKKQKKAKAPKAKKDDSAKKAHEDYLQRLHDQERAAKDHYDKILEIQQKELDEEIKAHGIASKQADAIRGKMEETKKKRAEQDEKIIDLGLKAQRARNEEEIAEEQDKADEMEKMGLITHERRLQMEAGFQQRLYQLKRDELDLEAEANKDTVEKFAETRLKIEQLEAQHGKVMAKLASEQRVEVQKPWTQMVQTFQQGFAQMMQGILTGTMKWRDAMKQLFMQVAQSFIQAKSMELAKHLTVENLKSMASKVGAALRAAFAKSGAAQEMASNVQGATTAIGANAAAAGAGAAQSQASIPYVGPILAVAAMAAIFAAVIGMKSKMSSAAGGFDIPAGVNPLTQLHAEEMVLPAKYANAIREMTENGGAGGKGDTYHLQVAALDARSLQDAMRRNPSALAAGMTSAARNGHLNGSKLML